MNYYLLAAIIWVSIGSLIGGGLMAAADSAKRDVGDVEEMVMRWTFFWPFFLLAVLSRAILLPLHEASARSAKKK